MGAVAGLLVRPEVADDHEAVAEPPPTGRVVYPPPFDLVAGDG